MNDSLHIELPTEQDSVQLAQRLAHGLTAPLVMTLSGAIGCGKTTLIRAMLRELGVHSAIKSPTFSLVESYQINNLQLHHFDLYRIHEESELELIGFRDYFATPSICCIEWPEHAPSFLRATDVQFTLSIKGTGRDMVVNAFTQSGKAVISCLAGEQ